MKPVYLMILLILAAPVVSAQGSYTEDQVVNYAKALDVRKLDRTLPSQRLDEWLRSGPAHFDTVVWQVSPDCDLNVRGFFEVSNKKGELLCVKFGFGRGGVGDFVTWEMKRDCDLKPPTGETPRQGAAPCPRPGFARGRAGSDVDGWGLIAVGTFRQGISGRPRFRHISVGTPGGGYWGVEKLSDLPRFLQKTSSSTTSENEMLTYARTLDVQKLDPTLPSQGFEEWLRSGPAHIDVALWGVSLDCNLKDPGFEIPNPDDWPICVKVDYARGVGWGEAMIIVGTRGKGISGSPHLDYGTLSEIPQGLDVAHAWKQAVLYAKELDIAKLDPTLLSRRIDEWLLFGPAHLDKVEWQISPSCGLEVPESRAPDWPLCVWFTFSRHGAGGSGMMIVGTLGKGVNGPPRLEQLEIWGAGVSQSATKLSDIPLLLDEVSSQTIHK